MNTSFKERIAATYTGTAVPRLAQMIGDGIAIVYDSEGEFDVLFDTDMWQVSLVSCKKECPDVKIGILEGVAKAPQVESFAEALAFAEWIIKNKETGRDFSVSHEPKEPTRFEKFDAIFRKENAYR